MPTRPLCTSNDITALTAKYRVYAAIGFALDHRDCTDENGEKYLEVHQGKRRQAGKRRRC